MSSPHQPADGHALDPLATEVLSALGRRSIVLVGMMGAGKSSIGRRLAMRLGLPFVDSDTEIERSAGLTIPEYFARHGEASFREGERRVIARLLAGDQKVIATGGGAFVSEETRARIAEHGLSVWLRAEADVLMRRVRKRPNRPLLQTADPEATLRNLIDQRYPIYARAAVTVQSRDVPHEVMVDAALTAIRDHLHDPVLAPPLDATP